MKELLDTIVRRSSASGFRRDQPAGPGAYAASGIACRTGRHGESHRKAGRRAQAIRTSSKPARPGRVKGSSSTLSDQVGKSGSGSRRILHVAKIGRAHGLLGESRAIVLSSDPDRLDGLRECLLVSADEKTSRAVLIEDTRRSQDHWILKIKGVDDGPRLKS